ncbi:MAG TPA: alpha/beta hydrolase [Anaerolineae bacterium]
MPILIAQGEPIYYQQHKGNPARPPLVLVHGAGGNHMHWPPEVRRLAGPAVYALDLPGHGKSGGPGRTSIARYAEAVASIAEALRLPRFVLAGHSMGGAIAQEYALNWPEKLAGLILVGTGARLPVSPQILDGILTDYAATTALVTRWAYGDHVAPALLAEYTRRLRQVPASLIHGDYEACEAFDRRPDVARIVLPTLVLCGGADRMTPPKFSQSLAEQISGAKLVLIPGAGHMVMLEQPAAVAGAVGSFLAGVPG